MYISALKLRSLLSFSIGNKINMILFYFSSIHFFVKYVNLCALKDVCIACVVSRIQFDCPWSVGWSDIALFTTF